MNQIVIFILGAAVGGAWVWLWFKNKINKGAGEEKTLNEIQNKESLIEKQAREKIANKEAILELLETQGKLMNNHIEMMLSIPESTVTRYMDELEKEGKVKQVGDTGAGVFYEKI